MTSLNKKAFEGTGSLIQRANKASDKTFGPLIKRLTPIEEPEHLDWAGDADWARLQQEPLRARSLLRLAALVLLVLVVWAAGKAMYRRHLPFLRILKCSIFKSMNLLIYYHFKSTSSF